MVEKQKSDADQQCTHRDTDNSTTRRKFMQAGSSGAALLGIMGYTGVAKAEKSRRTPTNTNRNGSDGGLTLDGDLKGLLQRNRLWTAALPDGYFSDVQESQAPSVTSVCCSDSRVSQEGMFLDFLEPGFLFSPSNIGNKVISLVDGERVVNGNFLYGLENADSENGVVVGHTDCGAITAAYKMATGQDLDEPPGIDQELEVLVDIVNEGLGTNLVDTGASDPEIINQLVEYNVNQQIQFLIESDEVSDSRNLYGFVYDFQGVYADTCGKTYLVNIDGETDQSELKRQVSDHHESFVQSLLR